MSHLHTSPKFARFLHECRGQNNWNQASRGQWGTGLWVSAQGRKSGLCLFLFCFDLKFSSLCMRTLGRQLCWMKIQLTCKRMNALHGVSWGVHPAPLILEFSLDKLQEKIAFLEENGLDVAKHLHIAPCILSCSLVRSLLAERNFFFQKFQCAALGC